MLQLCVFKFKSRSSDKPSHIHDIQSTGNERVLTVPNLHAYRRCRLIGCSVWFWKQSGRTNKNAHWVFLSCVCMYKWGTGPSVRGARCGIAAPREDSHTSSYNGEDLYKFCYAVFIADLLLCGRRFIIIAAFQDLRAVACSGEDLRLILPCFCHGWLYCGTTMKNIFHLFVLAVIFILMSYFINVLLYVQCIMHVSHKTCIPASVTTITTVTGAGTEIGNFKMLRVTFSVT